MDLENKLKAEEMKNQELEKEIHSLELIQKNQEKELEKITGNTEANNKIKALYDQLKATKEKNRETEKKLQAESAGYHKQHNHLLDLQEKYQKIKAEKIRWKKAIADKQAAPPPENAAPDKKSEEEILRTSIKSLQKRLDGEKLATKKSIDAIRAEMTEYQTRLKEAEQENRLNTAKLAELKKQLRHNQLKPLKEDNPGADPADLADSEPTFQETAAKAEPDTSSQDHNDLST